MTYQTIGVRHQRKKSAEGEPKPTQLCVIPGGGHGFQQSFVLKTEDEELAYLRSSHFDLTDVVAMILGGSGDALAVAFARQGAMVLRIPSFAFKKERGDSDKENDARLLAKLANEKPQLFYKMSLRDQGIIRVAALWQLCEEAMMARIACGNRLHQRLVGRLLMDEGEWPEGKIEDQVKAVMANDKVYNALESDEARYLREMTRELEKLDIYTQLFQSIEGVGPKIAARIISAVQDIRRFPTEHAFKSYCGLSVTDEGEFMRRRRGQVCSYSPGARQAFFLLQDQFNRRPKSPWGQKLLENKKRIREVHPEPVMTKNKSGKEIKMFSDGHVLKRAMWRTSTQFCVWLYKEWTKIATAE